jgi:hypothetical protein
VDDPAGPDPVLLGPLVTAADVEAVLGSGVRYCGTPTAFATTYQGTGVTVSFITLSGRIGEINARAGRRSGRPLPGIGDEAWLLHGGKMAVIRVGGRTVKLTVRGEPARVPPDAITNLAAIVAERLMERSEIS